MRKIVRPPRQRTKRCSNCREDRPLSEFSTDRSAKDRLLACCKDCDKVKRGRYREQTRTVTSKRCVSCQKTKDAAEFNKNKRQADGLATWCRLCEKDYRDANKADRAVYHAAWQAANLKCTAPGCDVLVYGTGHTRCDEHHAAAVNARQQAALDRETQRQAGKQAAVQAILKTRRCEECGGPIPAKVKIDAKYCGKVCRDAVNKRRQHQDYEANREAYLEQVRAHRLANPRLGTLAAARRRAALLGVPFALTVDDLPDELGDCVICARELVVGTRKVTPSSPTIDRVVPELGYVQGNVLAWVCFGCNARKHNKTLDELADGAAGEHWQALGGRLPGGPEFAAEAPCRTSASCLMRSVSIPQVGGQRDEDCNHLEVLTLDGFAQRSRVTNATVQDQHSDKSEMISTK